MHEPPTPPIPNKGSRGFRTLLLASIFVAVDNDVLRNPLRGIAVSVSGHCEGRPNKQLSENKIIKFRIYD